jgi:hypothetical protein
MFAASSYPKTCLPPQAIIMAGFKYEVICVAELFVAVNVMRGPELK